tara:strand:+ start:16616 stop:19975 length:3360 start_codon:yes stop_codon:yes gene_type:complete
MSKKENINTLNDIFTIFINNFNKFKENEMFEFEVRFGTKKIRQITRIDFYNVIKSLLNNDFVLDSEEYNLRIILDDSNSNLRTNIKGLNDIQKYCKTNNISNIDDNNLEFLEKNYHYNDGEKCLYDFDDYNFRISQQIETVYNKTNEKVKDILINWPSRKKIFRFMKRFVFKNNRFPFLLHLSIVKMSNKNSNERSFINIKDADVFNSNEIYEIEIEFINSQIKISKKKDYSDIILLLKETIKYVLIGLQQTNYPISLSESNNIIEEYLTLIKKNTPSSSNYSSRDFIGPSSLTLQKMNCIESNNLYNVANIRKNYTVTDKADGLRKLLFINNIGNIYLLNTNLHVQFTGYRNKNKELNNTIIDGEHILHDKNMEYINLFMAFDIYYLNNKNVTGLALVLEKTDEKQTSRLELLTKLIKEVKIVSVVESDNIDFKINVKTFYRNENIFKACNTLIDKINKKLFEYETDGIIFTPANTGVANDKLGVDAPNFKVTWNESFKWKPSEFNTIDFLIKFKKDDFNKKMLYNIFNDGNNVLTSENVTKYYTLFLYVGFDEKKHGYINPFNDIINDNIKTKKDKLDYNNNYRPSKFYPSNPHDNTAHICNIIAKIDSNNNYKIYTEDGDEIEDNSIVEFRYDLTKKNEWRWIPLKVRYDKTTELRNGEKNFGNSYHVANSNWHTIHYPLDENMITTGNNILLDNTDDDVYYNKIQNTDLTRGLRDFHNLGVKNMLIKKIVKPGSTLIDYACGKGGDLPKWISAKLKFILGVDLSKDNIENRLDGACARYLNYSKKIDNMPGAIFLNANSGLNLKSGTAFYDEKSKHIFDALNGTGNKSEIVSSKGVYKHYGIVSHGFNVSSIQFALHYMFETVETLNNFIKNISECTALNGYLIGTCYNGNKVFNMLSKIDQNKSISLFNKQNKIWEITKRYNNTEFKNDESCMGYAIDIYQESINKTFREYLVNFTYLNRVLENYGFVKLSHDDLNELDLTNSVNSFEELYNDLFEKSKYDINLKKTLGNTFNMTKEEKEISFLNNYFIYKKVRHVTNVEKLDITANDKIEELDKQLENIELEKSEEIKPKIVEEKSSSIDISKKKSIEEKTKEIEEKIRLAKEKKRNSKKLTQ